MRRTQSAQSLSTSRSQTGRSVISHPTRCSTIARSFLKTTLKQPPYVEPAGALQQQPSELTSNIPSLPIHPASFTEVISRAQDLMLSGGEPMEPHFGLRGMVALTDSIREQIQDKIAKNISFPSNITSLSDLQTSLQSSLMALVTSLPSPPSLELAFPDLPTSLDSEAIGTRLVLSAEATSAAAWAVVRQQLELFVNSGGSHGGSGGAHDLLVLAIVTPAVLAAIAASLPTNEGLKSGGYPNDDGPDDNDPEDRLSTNYSAAEVAAYFKKRPLKVAARAAQVAAELAAFGASLSIDIATGNVDKNEAARSVQLRAAIERLGPAFIKIAQALSTRGDLLSPEYFKQIASLQDRVPPFSNEEAFEEMKRALGREPSELFETISDQPIAAASLGQVYRATLRPEIGGAEVAVKVQRPRVLEQVALDLYLMREAAVKIKESNDLKLSEGLMKQAGPDWPAVIDEWAGRFFSEMDFSKEARNAKILKQQLSSLQGIVIADVKDELTSRTVLVSEWIYGEKLGESSAADVRELCTTLLNAYLIMLLETGFLHADPHPGNLIRTPDGRICILDYGLMTEINENQRWALLEYIAHLSTEDWSALAKDLQVLGFIPLSVDTEKETGLVQQLGVILKQLIGGGGAAKMNIDKVTSELEELGKNYPFQIPPFFSLILRAFSVIEGIALGVDPDYAIVQECFPYLSRRLLTDDSPRSKEVLRDLIYGRSKNLSLARIERIANGFQAFSVDGVSEGPRSSSALSPPSRALPQSSGVTSSPAAPLDPMVKEVAIAILGRRGTYVQEVLVNEAVKAVDALSRETLTLLLRALLGNNVATIALSSLSAFTNPLKSFLPSQVQSLVPPTPTEALSRLSNVLELNQEDKESLALIVGVLRLMQGSPGQQSSNSISSSITSLTISQVDVSPTLAYLGSTLDLLPEVRPGLSWMSENFTRLLIQRALQRASLLVRS